VRLGGSEWGWEGRTLLFTSQNSDRENSSLPLSHYPKDVFVKGENFACVADTKSLLSKSRQLWTRPRNGLTEVHFYAPERPFMHLTVCC
jgi:hypothetical protein